MIVPTKAREPQDLTAREAGRENEMVYKIKKSKYEAWGYEITAKGFHNIAPSVESAINYLKDRYGADVKYRIA